MKLTKEETQLVETIKLGAVLLMNTLKRPTNVSIRDEERLSEMAEEFGVQLCEFMREE